MNKLSILKRGVGEKNALSSLNSGPANFNEIVNKLFEDSWLASPSLLSQSAVSGWLPKTDVVETDKSIKIKMNLPGVDPDKVKIEADENVLIISGSTERENEEKGENYYRMERESGEFRRSFELPYGCDFEKIEAKTKHGTLDVIIPKKAEAQKKKISIKVD